jgi:hypothetical protein
LKRINSTDFGAYYKKYTKKNFMHFIKYNYKELDYSVELYRFLKKIAGKIYPENFVYLVKGESEILNKRYDLHMKKVNNLPPVYISFEIAGMNLFERKLMSLIYQFL